MSPNKLLISSFKVCKFHAKFYRIPCNSIRGRAIERIFGKRRIATNLPRILLYGIVQRFAFNILTLKDDIDIAFGGIADRGHCSCNFSRIFRKMQILRSIE